MERILDAQCGILLGEAGIGKSEAMDQLEARVRGGSNRLVKLDFGMYADPQDLATDLFDTRIFQDWYGGGIIDCDIRCGSCSSGYADHLAGQLHGELPARVNLWNEPNPGVFRPRDEEPLSDTVARHLREELRERGIVMNRSPDTTRNCSRRCRR